MAQPFFKQSLCELEGNSCATKILAGVAASRLIRVHNRECVRQPLRPGKMMISDDEINARAACAFGSGKGAGAGVHADHQANPRRGGALDDIPTQIVPFTNTVGYVEIGRPSAKLNHSFQDDHGGGAIDVVIAVDQDSFLALNGSVETLNGSFHTSQ